MTDRRKKALARIIRDHGLILIEDDIMAFLTAGLLPDYQGPLYRLVPDQTVYLCGTSKSICSGLRVTYMVFGEPFRENLLKALYNINVKTSSVDAEIISAVIASGKAREIVEKKRLLAKKRQALFDRYFPNGGNCGHPYSFFRWLPIADTRRGAEIEQELLTHGIRVYHSDRFLSGHHEDARYLRIALSTVDTGRNLVPRPGNPPAVCAGITGYFSGTPTFLQPFMRLFSFEASRPLFEESPDSFDKIVRLRRTDLNRRFGHHKGIKIRKRALPQQFFNPLIDETRPGSQLFGHLHRFFKNLSILRHLGNEAEIIHLWCRKGPARCKQFKSPGPADEARQDISAARIRRQADIDEGLHELRLFFGINHVAG